MTNEAEQNSQNAQNPETKVEKMFEYGYVNRITDRTNS